ncbi:AGE family epimerase/isomerase [Pedobacter immunditicola]|uniref:AGE family epimerase/isomerase n=1 Tax=Pedobacter immunditicola TaxID=3133440 RepID=UPI0030A69BCF
MEINSHQQLAAFADELGIELQHILKNWMLFNFRKSGVISNARVLWAFSAAFNLKTVPDLNIADKTYYEIVNRFIDIDFGGVFLTVDDHGQPNDTKKEIYALACSIDAFSEYFMACGDELVKDHAVAMYRDLVKHGHDTDKGGYFEAFNRSWGTPADFFEDKAAAEKKTMNTQLQVLEAFTNLYRIWPDEDLKVLIVALLNDFAAHVVYAKTSASVSLGNSLKAAWILPDAAAVIEHVVLMAVMKTYTMENAQTTLNAFTNAESLSDLQKKCWIKAEALISFFHAWQITGDKLFLKAALKIWNIIKSGLFLKGQGESCFFFNSRACLEILKRYSKTQ